jgi:hypothetical protein
MIAALENSQFRPHSDAIGLLVISWRDVRPWERYFTCLPLVAFAHYFR